MPGFAAAAPWTPGGHRDQCRRPRHSRRRCLRAAGLEVLPTAAGMANPRDLIASADAMRFGDHRGDLAADDVDAVIAIYTTIDSSRTSDILAAIANGVAEGPIPGEGVVEAAVRVVARHHEVAVGRIAARIVVLVSGHDDLAIGLQRHVGERPTGVRKEGVVPDAIPGEADKADVPRADDTPVRLQRDARDAGLLREVVVVGHDLAVLAEARIQVARDPRAPLALRPALERASVP